MLSIAQNGVIVKKFSVNYTPMRVSSSDRRHCGSLDGENWSNTTPPDSHQLVYVSISVHQNAPLDSAPWACATQLHIPPKTLVAGANTRSKSRALAACGSLLSFLPLRQSRRCRSYRPP